MERRKKAGETAQSDCGSGRSRAVRSVGQPTHRILAVDDSPDALTILRLFLSAQGYEVITAESVSEAQIRVHEHFPDLVITDYLMPEMTGLDLCQRLRSHHDTRHIPIVLHTGTDLPPGATPLYDALCTKPADLAVLARIIRSLLHYPSQRSRAVPGEQPARDWPGRAPH